VRFSRRFLLCRTGARALLSLALMASMASAAGVPLLDATGASHGSAKVVLARGIVQLKIAGLARLPASVSTGTAVFTAHEYKAYLVSTADPAVEVWVGDVYPDGRTRAVRKTVLGGDLTQMGLDRLVVTAFSKDGVDSFDVLSATVAP
jgi:hypothetical protein